MNCKDVRTFLGPYLDSELDPTTSYELGLHLNACADCRTRVERERGLESVLAAAVAGRDATTSEMWARALARLEPRPGRRRRPWLAFVLASAAAALALALAAWTLFPARPPDLLEAAVRDHEEFLGGKFGPELATNDPARAAAFLRERVAVSAQLPPDTAGYRLLGVRCCVLRGALLGLALYSVGGAPASVFLLPERELEAFPELRAELAPDGTVLARQCRGRIVIARAAPAVRCTLVVVGESDHGESLKRLAGEIAAR